MAMKKITVGQVAGACGGRGIPLPVMHTATTMQRPLEKSLPPLADIRS